jgi:hypothetical protein
MSLDKKALIASIGKNIESIKTVVTSEKKVNKPAVSPLKEVESEKKSPKPIKKDKSLSTIGTGKQAAFWLDDEDRALFHEFGMLLYSQGIKPSHNLVLRAALRLVPKDHLLTEKVRELLAQDGRKVRHQK